jgi:anthranilate synthase/aminodeoxychorismate synthase-like glutamine amidotransferase
MVVLIDNRDSFVFNLARYLDELGMKTHVVRSDQVSLKQLFALNPSHLIISPGPCTPLQAGISMRAIEHMHKTIPILGVCLGHQAIAAVFGGQVIRADNAAHGKQDMVSHNQQGIFENLPSPLPTARYHSLVVAPDQMPDCLEVTAMNNQNVIMGIRHTKYPTYGVQFHPESVLTQMGHQLLKNFINQAADI